MKQPEAGLETQLQRGSSRRLAAPQRADICAWLQCPQIILLGQAKPSPPKLLGLEELGRLLVIHQGKAKRPPLPQPQSHTYGGVACSANRSDIC